MFLLTCRTPHWSNCVPTLTLSLVADRDESPATPKAFEIKASAYGAAPGSPLDPRSLAKALDAWTASDAGLVPTATPSNADMKESDAARRDFTAVSPKIEVMSLTRRCTEGRMVTP